MNTQNQMPLTIRGSAKLASVLCLLDHPDKVLKHPRLSRGEKRALLASWASDSYAVEDQPTLRRLDGGNIIPVEQILSALKALDEMPDAGVGTSSRVSPWRAYSRGRSFLDAWRRSGKSSGPDDDDPPPCPATLAPRPRAPAGMGAKAYADLACA